MTPNSISKFLQTRSAAADSSKEWHLIEKLLNKAFNEQTKARRWSIFFKLLTFAYLILALWLFSPYLPKESAVQKSHTALIDVNGEIADGKAASVDNIVTALHEAFKQEHVVGIILRINSPGGSPVQSGLVYREILRLREQYPNKKVYASITDLGASGAYYIAAAADEIYADPASIVGSIGVISAGFGFTEALEKLGVERRVWTAGNSKAILDPFAPLNPSDTEHLQDLLNDIHQQFINSVKENRGDRLAADDKLYSGLMWTGSQALELGLVDALGSSGHIARTVIGTEKIINYTVKPSPFDLFVNRFSDALVGKLIGAGQGHLVR